LTGKLPAKEKGHGWDRNPLNSLEPAGGIEPSIKLISNQMSRRDKQLILIYIFRLPARCLLGRLAISAGSDFPQRASETRMS